MRLMLQRVARITFDRVSTLGRSGHGSTDNIRRLFDDETISHASNGHFQNVDNERNERKKINVYTSVANSKLAKIYAMHTIRKQNRNFRCIVIVTMYRATARVWP